MPSEYSRAWTPEQKRDSKQLPNGRIERQAHFGAICQGHSKVEKNGSFSLIERVILSAGAMLIFSVSFQIDHKPEGEEKTSLQINMVVVASRGGKGGRKAGRKAPVPLSYALHGPGHARSFTKGVFTR
jgi:hypothetical protein